MKDLYFESGRIIPKAATKLSTKEFLKELQSNITHYQWVEKELSRSSTENPTKRRIANTYLENTIYLMQEYFEKLSPKQQEKLLPAIKAISMEKYTADAIKQHPTHEMKRFYDQEFKTPTMPRFSFEKEIYNKFHSIHDFDKFKNIVKSNEFQIVKENFPSYFNNIVKTVNDIFTTEKNYGNNERLLMASVITNEVNYYADTKPLENKGDYKKALQEDFEELKEALKELETNNPHEEKERLSYPAYAKKVVPYRKALQKISYITQRPSFAKNTDLPWLEKLQEKVFKQIAELGIDPRIVNDLLYNNIKLPGHEQEILNNKTKNAKTISIDETQTRESFDKQVDQAERHRRQRESFLYTTMVEAEDTVKKALHKVNKMSEEKKFMENANFNGWSWADDYKRAQVDLEIAKTKLKEAEIAYENFMNS